MLRDITEARALNPYHIWLRFDDGVEGVVDLAEQVGFRGIFAALRDPAEFATLFVNHELGTVCWPNGADLDPLALYSVVTGQDIRLSGLSPTRV